MSQTRLPAESRTNAVFDALADDYDAIFTNSQIGRRMRKAVWDRLDARFVHGDRVLEINCGTGEDAVHLAKRGVTVFATDASRRMIEIARTKAAGRNLQRRIDAHAMAIESLSAEELDADIRPFDGAFSNFGGLNCVDDIPGAARRIAACLRPGAKLVVCVMGRVCLWEWGWYLLHGQPRKAFRRLTSQGARWRGITVRYPTVSEVRRAFEPRFRCLRVSGVGAILPPSFAEEWARSHPHLLDHLDIWERRYGVGRLLPCIADHILMEFERVGSK